ncbi:MAG: hypothetical protein LZF62_420060 [Nitrospira sp.]|nr:MAG: hypothetical protein LZF62_420060 [Nitrospira sp.]
MRNRWPTVILPTLLVDLDRLQIGQVMDLTRRATVSQCSVRFVRDQENKHARFLRLYVLEE